MRQACRCPIQESKAWDRFGAASGTAFAVLTIIGVTISLGLAGSILPDYKGDWQVAKLLLVMALDHLLILTHGLAALVGATAIVGDALQRAAGLVWRG